MRERGRERKGKGMMKGQETKNHEDCWKELGLNEPVFFAAYIRCPSRALSSSAALLSCSTQDDIRKHGEIRSDRLPSGGLSHHGWIIGNKPCRSASWGSRGNGWVPGD